MTRTLSLLGVGVVACWICACNSASEPRKLAVTTRPLTVETGFQDQLVLRGLVQPTAVRFAKDGRIFIAEKSGLIKLFDPANDTAPHVLADLRTNVHNYWDRGLLDIALHPDFPETPYLYALYTYDGEIGGRAPRWGKAGATTDDCPTPPGANDSGCVAAGRLSRLEVDGDATRGLEEVLLENWPQQYPSHSLGTIAFGQDGMLYVSGGEAANFNAVDYGQLGIPANSLGDPPVERGEVQTPPLARGGAVRAQNDELPRSLARFNGKVLRVDPLTAAAAPGNPLEDSTVPGAAAIVAKGLRNPYRMTFRPGTNELWIGDVGWGGWEEINRLVEPLGPTLENFGWPCFEGPDAQPAYAAAGLSVCNALYASNQHSQPYYVYHHDEPVLADDECGAGQAAISGLAFYTDGVYPAAYHGALFFSDYARNCLWVMLPGENGLPDPTSVQVFGRQIPEPVQLLIGPGNDLYYTSLRGELHRIAALGQNRAPIAKFSLTPPEGAVPLTVEFDAGESSDPDRGDTLTYAWDLDGDGAFDDATTSSTQYVYTSAGERTVSLQVTDSRGAIATTSQSVTAGGAGEGLAATIAASTPDQFRVGDVIEFAGEGTDASTPLPAASLRWDLVVQHCPTADHCHPHVVQSFEGVESGSFVAPEHDYPYHLELILRVTAPDGREATAVQRLDPRTVTLTVDSDPPGVPIGVNHAAPATPFEATLALGSQNTISAPDLAGFTFVGWSDEGAQARVLVADEPTTLVATYDMSAKPVQLKQYATIISRVETPNGGGSETPEVIRDGEYPRPGSQEWEAQFDTLTDDRDPKEDWIGYAFQGAHAFTRVVFQEGGNFVDGGWFENLGVRVRRNGTWLPVRSLTTTPAYPGTSDGVGFRSYEISFEAIVGDAIAIFGPAGGASHFVSVAELDVFGWRANASPEASTVVRVASSPALVVPGDTVTLDARASFDPNGQPLTYSWAQVSGPAVTLSGAQTAAPRFTAPSVSSASSVAFELTLSAGSRTERPTRVAVTITPLTAAVDITPRADITLSELAPTGFGSKDPEVLRDGIEPAAGSFEYAAQYDAFTGDVTIVEGWLGYTWSESWWLGKLEFREGAEFFDGGWFSSLRVEVRRDGVWYPVQGQTFEPSYPFAANGVGFEAYEIAFEPVRADGVRLFGVMGGAARFFSASELRAIAVPPPETNARPWANAGADIVVTSGRSVTLNGAASLDPEGAQLRYAWTSSTTSLSGATTSEPKFTAPVVRAPTQLTFTLGVNDGELASTGDSVVVTVEPARGRTDLTSLGVIISSEGLPAGAASYDPEVIRDGFTPISTETDPLRQYATFNGERTTFGWIGYQLPEQRMFGSVMYQEGQHFFDGGWFTTLEVQVRRDGEWRSVTGLTIDPDYAAEFGPPWQSYTLAFDPAIGDAIRIAGVPGGAATFLTIAELRVFSP